MAASAAFSINGTSSGAVIVTPSTTVNLAVLSVTGVRSIEWRIVAGSDPSIAAPVITPAGSPLGATATLAFTTESVAGLGLAWLIECKVNGGTPLGSNEIEEDLKKTMVFGKANSNLILPLVYGEEFERHATLGVYPDVNKALKNVGGGAGSQNLSSVLGFGASAGGVAITNLGAPSAGGDAATKTYVDGRTLAVLLAASTSAGGAKITNLGTPTNTTDAATKAYVDGLLGGGGGESLAATLAIGNTAGGLNIVGVGEFRSNAELIVKQITNDILTTSTGTTILNATSGIVAIQKAGGGIASFGQNASLNIFSGSNSRATFYIAVDAPSNANGNHIHVRASDGVGTNRNGGIVALQGGDPTGTGDIGYVRILKTDDSELASFKDTLITLGAELTSSSNGTFGYIVSSSGLQARTFLMVQGAGAGTPTGSTGDQRIRNGYAMVGRNQANSVDLQVLALDTSNRTVLGNATGETHVNGTTLDVYCGLKVRASGSGTAVASTAVINLPEDTTQMAVKRAAGSGGGDMRVLASSGNGLLFGDPSSANNTGLLAAAETYLSVAGLKKFRAFPAFLQMEVNDLSFSGLLTTPTFGMGSAAAGAGGAVRFSGQPAQASGNTNGGWAELVGGRPNGTGLKGGFKGCVRHSSNAPETMMHATEVATGRRVLNLFGDVTATEMPVNTGDMVERLAPAATEPTAAPASGVIRWVKPSNNHLMVWAAGAGAPVDLTP